MLIKIGPDGILEDKTMKLLNCVYETDTDLQAFITASDLAREANLLVQIFSGSTDRQKLRNLLSLLARELPQAAVIGASTSGELLECDYRTDSIVVSFACFQKVRVRSLLVPEGYGEHASRMESHGLPGHVQVTETVKNQLTDLFLFQERGLIDIKGKGVMRTYFLTGHADP